MRHLLRPARRLLRDHPDAHSNRDDVEIAAVALEVDVGQDADPAGHHHAGHHEPGPAQHEQRYRLDQRGQLGQQPSTTMMMPAATQTQRLLTPVTPTSPTFCEKLVYGKVLKMPPISVPRPSTRSPRRQ